MAQLKINPALARQFLLALYSSFFSQKSALAYLEVRGKAEGQGMSFRRFYRGPEALLKDMADLAAERENGTAALSCPALFDGLIND